MADTELQSIIQAIKNEIQYTMIRNLDACRKVFATTAANEIFGGEQDGGPSEEDLAAGNKYISRTLHGAFNGTYGVGDERSYEVTVGKDLSMTIESTVQGNPRYARSQGWDPGNITDIIEGGSGYHWEHSAIYLAQPVPRPWMDKAGEEFAENLLMPMIDIALTNLLGGN